MKSVKFGPLMEVSLRIDEMRLAGTLTRENFQPLLEEYASHGPSPEALEGMILSFPEDWVAGFLARRRARRSALA
jgi:hypothetical protein